MAVPPGGWAGVVHGIPFNAPTYAAYISAIELHQRHNALEWGDSVELGNTALCERWPEGCTEDNAVQLSPGLVEAAKRFISTVLRAGGRRTTQEEAERRAAICAGCHNNSDVPAAKGCSGCGQGTTIFTSPLWRFVDRLVQPFRASWLQSYATTQDNRLGACNVCGCNLKMAVFVPADAFDYTEQEKNAFPSFCWHKE